MSRASLVVGLAVLLIVSSLLVMGGGTARAQPAVAPTPQGAAHPAVTTLSLATYSSGDVYYNTSYYATGAYDTYGSNVLYFAVNDPALDSAVNFTLTDPNATRDGVGSPAFSATVTPNATTGLYYSYQHGVSYTFPASIVYGGGWVVTASGALGGTVSYNITLFTFETDFYATPSFNSAVLPGETINLYWATETYANGGLDNHVTNVTLAGWYDANGTYENLFAGGAETLTAGGIGSTTITIPANASSQTLLTLDLWVTIDYNGVVVENESYTGVEFGIGAVAIDAVWTASEYSGICPVDYENRYFDSGDIVQVCVEAGAAYEDTFTPVANIPVAIKFWNGDSFVTPTGGAPTTLTTNSSGLVAFTFQATNPPFSFYTSYPYENLINLTATDPAATTTPAGFWTDHDNSTSFYVYPAGADGLVNVQFSQLEYYPGQAITATWSLGSTDSSATGALTATAWYVDADETDNILAQGTITSTASTGTIAVTLPSGWVGGFGLEVMAINATDSFYGDASASLSAPQLFLNPSTTTYTPGQTVSVTAIAYGDAGATGVGITYDVYAESYFGVMSGGEGLVATGTVANDSSFNVVVPSTAAPSEYYIVAYLTGSTGALASAWVDLTQSWGYYVALGVNTPSNYADGSYQPGQTLTIGYQITPYGNAPLPLLYTFSVELGGTQVYNTVTSPSTSGTFQITVPSGQPSGVLILYFSLQGTYLNGNSCEDGYCSGTTAIVINAHPAALDMEVGGTSGITVGWLILLILIIVVAVVLGLLIWRKGRSPPPAAAATFSTAPMSTPAPAPSGTAPPEWKEPASDSPPMPTPPSGSS